MRNVGLITLPFLALIAGCSLERPVRMTTIRIDTEALARDYDRQKAKGGPVVSQGTGGGGGTAVPGPRISPIPDSFEDFRCLAINVTGPAIPNRPLPNGMQFCPAYEPKVFSQFVRVIPLQQGSTTAEVILPLPVGGNLNIAVWGLQLENATQACPSPDGQGSGPQGEGAVEVYPLAQQNIFMGPNDLTTAIDVSPSVLAGFSTQDQRVMCEAAQGQSGTSNPQESNTFFFSETPTVPAPGITNPIVVVKSGTPSESVSRRIYLHPTDSRETITYAFESLKLFGPFSSGAQQGEGSEITNPWVQFSSDTTACEGGIGCINAVVADSVTAGIYKVGLSLRLGSPETLQFKTVKVCVVNRAADAASVCGLDQGGLSGNIQFRSTVSGAPLMSHFSWNAESISVTRQLNAVLTGVSSPPSSPGFRVLQFKKRFRLSGSSSDQEELRCSDDPSAGKPACDSGFPGGYPWSSGTAEAAWGESFLVWQMDATGSLSVTLGTQSEMVAKSMVWLEYQIEIEAWSDTQASSTPIAGSRSVLRFGLHRDAQMGGGTQKFLRIRSPEDPYQPVGNPFNVGQIGATQNVALRLALMNPVMGGSAQEDTSTVLTYKLKQIKRQFIKAATAGSYPTSVTVLGETSPVGFSTESQTVDVGLSMGLAPFATEYQSPYGTNGFLFTPRFCAASTTCNPVISITPPPVASVSPLVTGTEYVRYVLTVAGYDSSGQVVAESDLHLDVRIFP